MSTFLLCTFFILILWIISILIKDISIIDTAFAPIILLITLLAIFLSNAPIIIKSIIFTSVSIWSIRLTYLMLQRKIGHGEDARYTKLRDWKKPGLNLNLFTLRQVYFLQGVVIWCVTLPIQFVLSVDKNAVISLINQIGLVIIVIGFIWEVISDIQLNNFKNNPIQTKDFLKTGLWAYSRHPNYFGEVVFWWGIYIFSISNYFSLISIIGPVVFTYLIFNITGVKTMDKRMSKNYPGYKDHINSTNAMIPKIYFK
ncbi:DUF1295 domain-containing protein [Gammaproteobacteria bacterium]|nr:DUF1295 domain-containing protein [Gammaproteobacteria bacterium]MDB4183591.1 DUF1295 domain-containing protein [Gammaproteobacteria bacterium]|tara:strand:- start:2065 stop:2832 length:768 start_codon:yes stop_codon:yes gene_type:complete